jgi:hypothetical protein
MFDGRHSGGEYLLIVAQQRGLVLVLEIYLKDRKVSDVNKNHTSQIVWALVSNK